MSAALQHNRLELNAIINKSGDAGLNIHARIIRPIQMPSGFRPKMPTCCNGQKTILTFGNNATADSATVSTF